MNDSEFVATLKSLAPSTAAMLEHGFSTELADRFVKSFVCRRRDVNLGIVSDGDPMLELVDKWDLSEIEIGPICFHKEPIVGEQNIEIGSAEGECLAFRRTSRDYVLIDSQRSDFVMCDVAPNGGQLLDVLTVIAGYYAKTAIGEIDIDDEEVGEEICEKCVAILGGSKYEAFCTSMLGV